MPATSERENWLGLLVVLSCMAIWGMCAVAFKIGTQSPSPLNAVLFNGVRFLVVAPVLAGLIAWRRPDALRVENKNDLWRYAAFGVFSIGISESLYTLASHYTSVANVTLLGPGTIGLFTGFWSAIVGDQKWGRAQLFGACVALGGVALVAGASGKGSFALHGTSFLGDALALGRSALHGLYMIYLARSLRERPVLTVTVYNILFGACAYVPYLLWQAPHIAWNQIEAPVWWSLTFAIVPTTLYGFAAWNWGIRKVGAVAATNVFYLLPVFGAVAAWAALGEPLHWAQIGGGLVIVLGILILRWEEVRLTRFGQWLIRNDAH